MLTENEKDKLDTFLEKHRNCFVQLKAKFQQDYILKCSETAMGTIITVQCPKCNEKKDITDYSKF